MSGEPMLLNFDGLSKPVRLVNCKGLYKKLPLAFPGWTIDVEPDTTQSPILTVTQENNSYIIEGFWLPEPLLRNDMVDAICALVAELIRAYVSQDDRLLCLHGAAAEFGDRLVVFPSRYRAGKSILCACLSAAGTRLFCDDILPLKRHDGEAIAPGLATRLRLPLPENLETGSRRFIENHTRLRGRNYCYLDFGAESLALLGEHRAIGAFVLLERESGVEAAFEAIGEAEVLAQVVWQNFARETEAPVILKVLNRLVAGARRFRLRYDRAEDAVELLQQEFARWPVQSRPKTDSSPQVANVATNVKNLAPGYFRQSPGISILEVDHQYFLADREGAAIHQLNQIGSSVWGLLVEPMTSREIVDLLMHAFPDLEREQVTTDVNLLLQELIRKNLLQTGR